MMLSPKGEWVYALVVVAEYNGVVRVKVVFPENSSGVSTLALTGSVSDLSNLISGEVLHVVAQETSPKPNRPIESPYQDFSFTTCQQTRAPNY